MKFLATLLDAIKSVHRANNSNENKAGAGDVFYTIDHTIVV